MYIDRNSLFRGFLAVTLAVYAGLIFGVRLNQSPNDAARWDTIWSLVEHNTYQIFDTKEEAAKYEVAEQYLTIDKVQRDGKFYSSKPPLFPTVVAVMLKPFRALGPRIEKDDPGKPMVGTAHRYFKPMLMVVNLLPFAAFLAMYKRLVDSEARTDFAWIVSLATAGFGTLISAYLTTLNNHSMAACAAGIAVLLLLPVWRGERPEPWRLVLGGLFVGWTAANELPAAAFAALALLLTLRRTVLGALFGFLPPLVLVTAAFFHTNYQSFGSYIPAYLQPELYDYKDSYWRSTTKSAIDALSDPDENGNYREGPRVAADTMRRIKGLVKKSDDSAAAKPAGLFVSPIYLMHMTVGHHGVLSMTPIWLFAGLGAFVAWGRNSAGGRLLWLGVAGLSLVVILFYWAVNTERNYGGFCHGMRWLVWLAPFWLLYLPAGLDAVANSKIGRGAALACLFVSIFSAADAWWNPWTYSWIHRLFIWCGAVGY